ncbi:MAG TPA: DUF554 domain-containing protein [Negativicutes bacterium]|nr:DUF554 domain-containing protein [Negativicutes bacterium]
MLGTFVNFAAIIVGGLVGTLLKGGVSPKIGDTVMKGLALSVLLVGIMNALKVNNLLLVIIAMVLGGILGEWLDIDQKLKSIGDTIGIKLKGRGGRVSDGFVTGSLVYCVGAMAIVGSLESGLSGNHQTLFAKSILDGISSIIFASTLGIGVVLSAFTVLIYQGAITLAASFLQPLLAETVKADMNSIGGLLIIGISLNMMGHPSLKVANLLPAIFVPIAYQLISLFI